MSPFSKYLATFASTSLLGRKIVPQPPSTPPFGLQETLAPFRPSNTALFFRNTLDDDLHFQALGMNEELDSLLPSLILEEEEEEGVAEDEEDEEWGCNLDLDMCVAVPKKVSTTLTHIFRDIFESDWMLVDDYLMDALDTLDTFGSIYHDPHGVFSLISSLTKANLLLLLECSAARLYFVSMGKSTLVTQKHVPVRPEMIKKILQLSRQENVPLELELIKVVRSLSRQKKTKTRTVPVLPKSISQT